MRSIVKLLAYILVAILIPSLVMGLVTFLKASELVVIISQFIIMLLLVISFTKSFEFMRTYELRTNQMIKQARSIEELRRLREKRLTYKSKAMVTREILNRGFSKEEANNLRKYTDSVNDMKHYFSALISCSSGKEREEIKIRRDNFNKKYANRHRIYPDFKENLKTSIKWLVAFFLLLGPVSIGKKSLSMTPSFLYLLYLLGLAMLLAFMINAIIWLIRTTTSFWDRKYI